MMTPQFDKLCTKKQAHPSYQIRHMQPMAHGPLQDITLLVI